MLINPTNQTSVISTASVKPDVQSSTPAAPQHKADTESVREAIAAANKVMRSLSNSLEFSIDPESGKTVVRLIDDETHQVIRQMPSEEMLAIARAIDQRRGLLVNRDA